MTRNSTLAIVSQSNPDGPNSSSAPSRKVAMISWALAVLLSLASQALPQSKSSPNDTSENSSREPRGEIALTFDDLPVARSYGPEDRNKITEGILNWLTLHEAPATGFVISSNIDSDWKILAAWLDNGHTLGSHTSSHYDLHVVSSELFIEDMVNGATQIEAFLQGFGQKKRFFRHPYLHYGESEKVRQRIEGILKDRKHIIGHVSVDTDDYLYNLSMEGIRRSTDSSKFAVLREEYIDHILQSLFRAEGLARHIVKRPVKQILLLHANRLNSIFLGDLLVAIREYGYKFITLEEAIQDPVYRMDDNYYGPNGISKLERIARSDPNFVPPEF